ncbi:MAG: linear amide C-N hydrolase [Candidatus Aminicenantes bacterium]|nr:linear amide C-N hydrolase [Candidatus Aminicenantes bacterium]
MTRKGAPLLLLALSCLLVLPGCRRDNGGDEPEPESLLQTYDRRFQQFLAQAQQEMGKEILMYSPVSDAVTIPKRMDIQGSHHEYGTLVGRLASLHGHRPQRVADSRRELNARIIDMYRRIHPPYLDLARGLGEVFEIPLEEMDLAHLEQAFFANFWTTLFRYNGFRNLASTRPAPAPLTVTHCSILFARVGSDLLVGRNFDQDHEKPQWVVFSRMGGGYAVLANACYVPYHWIMDGVNEKGLFMGTANLSDPAKYYWNDPYPGVPAVCEHHLFRIALETCATVDEVIALYRSVRPWSANGTDHALVADAQGNSVVIEFDMERRAVFFPAEKSYQLMTNTAYQEGKEYMLSHCSRFSQGTAMAEEGIRGMGDVERIIRAIRASSVGYHSFFDLRRRTMKLYRQRDFSTSYPFDLGE